MKETNDNIFKILDTRTGLYSTGGTWPSFNKKGKAWTKIGHVKAHLSQFEAIPDTWEIVEIEQRVCSSKLALDSFKAPDGKGYRSKLPIHLFGPQAITVPSSSFVSQPIPQQVQQVQQAQNAVMQVLMGQPLLKMNIIKP